MASSSSSAQSTPASSSRSYSYDVFLSFRGVDTRKTFVDHLYSAFTEKAIHAYKDGFSRGESIRRSLLKAIKESHIAVIIFSKNYAESSWCLEELTYIMKCRDRRGLFVIPVFYDVELTDVKNQKQKFEEAFGRHEKENSTKVESWRKALVAASEISGWITNKHAYGHESLVIKIIVNKILDKLSSLNPDVDKEFVGMTTQVQDLKSQLMDEFEHLKLRLEKIKEATNNFSKTLIIGSGGFGKVYQGEVSHSKGRSLVAIKRLDPKFGQGDPEFWKEIMMLSRYTHTNLISLLGFCDENDEKILVYEHAFNRSLDRHISSSSLTWAQRIKICLDAAKGLSYLHDPKGTQQRILHRDIKSANILLDHNWNAKISDMGLSKLGPANQPHTAVFSHVVGTPGYVDPLYFRTYILSKESDVYSFGVVLLEVLCGRLCFELDGNRELRVLVSTWIESHQHNKLDKIIFKDLTIPMDKTSLETFIETAFQCVRESRRPKIALVVKNLEIALKFQQSYEMKLCEKELIN